MSGRNPLDELLFSEATNAAGTSSQTVNSEPPATAHASPPEKPQAPQAVHLGSPAVAVPVGSSEKHSAFPSQPPPRVPAPAAVPAPVAAPAPAAAPAPTVIAPTVAASPGLSLVSVQGAMDNAMKK